MSTRLTSNVNSEEQRWSIIASAHDQYAAWAMLAGLPEHLGSRQGETGEIASVLRTKRVRVQLGDSLQSLALRHGCEPVTICQLNQLTAWPFVRSDTNSPSEGMAVRGDVIFVPDAQGTSRDTRVMNAQEQEERAWGVDIWLDEQRDEKEQARIASQDFALITGPALVMQSARTRMKRLAGYDVDEPADGIPNDIGAVSDSLRLQLLRTRIIAAIRLDPRISAVTRCNLAFAEGAVTVTWSATLTNGVPVGETTRLQS